MILQLSLFQIFFMALSIVGLSFSILYLFIGQSPQDSNEYETYRAPKSHANPHSAPHSSTVTPSYGFQSQPMRAAPAASERIRASSPPPSYRTSKGRKRKSHQRPSAGVIEVDFRDVGSSDSVAMDIIQLKREEQTSSGITGTLSDLFDLASSD